MNNDINAYIKSINDFVQIRCKKNISPPKIIFCDDAQDDDLDMKTGQYNTFTKTIIIWTNGRSLKDILRSYCHELIHHLQCIDNEKLLKCVSKKKISESISLQNIESDAYSRGNIYFRMWLEQNELH